MPNRIIAPNGTVTEPSDVKVIAPDGSVQSAKSVKVIDPAGTVTTVWSGLTIDDYEHNDLATYYGGDLANFNTQTVTVSEGTYALEGTASGRIGSYPGGGLPNYPSAGDTWKINTMNAENTGQLNVWWCMGGTAPGGINPGYYLDWDETNNNLNVWEYDGATYNRFIFIGGIGGHIGEWLTTEVVHNADNSMTVTVRDLAETTTYGTGTGTPANTTRTTGGIQIRKRGAGNQYVDNWRLV